MIRDEVWYEVKVAVAGAANSPEVRAAAAAELWEGPGNESTVTGPGAFTLTILNAGFLILPLYYYNKKDWF